MFIYLRMGHKLWQRKMEFRGATCRNWYSFYHVDSRD